MRKLEHQHEHISTQLHNYDNQTNKTTQNKEIQNLRTSVPLMKYLNAIQNYNTIIILIIILFEILCHFHKYLLH